MLRWPTTSSSELAWATSVRFSRKMSLPGPGFIQGCERTHGWLAAVAVAVATSRSWPRAGLVGGSPVCSSSRSSTGRHTPVSSQPLACSTVRVRCRATSPLGSPGDKRRALTSSTTGANRRTHWQEPRDGPGDCSLSCSTPDSSGQRVDLSSIQSGTAPVCLLPLRSASADVPGDVPFKFGVDLIFKGALQNKKAFHLPRKPLRDTYNAPVV